MRRRDRRMEQIKAVARERETLGLAAAALERLLAADPSLLRRHGLERANLTRAVDQLESTYLIRLFAEFESGLREAWRLAFRQRSHPKTGDLLAAVTARRQIPRGLLRQADLVRQHRNSLVHEGDDSVEPVAFAEASRQLCQFFSRLPPDW